MLTLEFIFSITILISIVTMISFSFDYVKLTEFVNSNHLEDHFCSKISKSLQIHKNSFKHSLIHLSCLKNQKESDLIE